MTTYFLVQGVLADTKAHVRSLDTRLNPGVLPETRAWVLARRRAAG